MYTNCRSISLLPWKIIADQDAEEYLRQSLLNKSEDNSPRNKETTGPGINDSARKTQYKERNQKEKPDTERVEIGSQTKPRAGTPRKITKRMIEIMIEDKKLTIKEGKIAIRHMEAKEYKDTNSRAK